VNRLEEEHILRRVLVSRNWYDPNTGRVSPNAFRAEKHDTDGISVSLRRLRSAKQEGESGRNPAGYHVAELPTSAVLTNSMTIEPSPVPENPGHAHIPELNYENRKEDISYERRQALADAVTGVHGPFTGSK